MSSSTDPAIIHRIERIERTLEQHGMRLEDLERAGSPDGVAMTQPDEMQRHVAQFCQHVRQTHGETQSDLIGG